MLGRKNRKTPFVREVDEELENLRDDTIALFINSGLNMRQVHEQGGPTPQTLSKWLYKETLFPRLSTIQAATRALGARVVILGEQEAAKQPQSRIVRLGVRRYAASAKLPPRKLRKRSKGQ